MLLFIVAVGIAIIFACATIATPPVWVWLHGKCFICLGTGTICDRGPRIPLEQLTPKEYGRYLVDGTKFYKPIARTCYKCQGTGLK